MHGGRDSEEKSTEAVATGADQPDDEHGQRQPDDAVGVIGTHQRDWIRGAVLGRARIQDDEWRAYRQQDVTAERIYKDGERLETDHAQDAAQQPRERDLR